MYVQQPLCAILPGTLPSTSPSKAPMLRDIHLQAGPGAPGGVWAPFLPPHHKLVHLILNTCRFVCPGSPLPFLAPTVSSVRMFLIVVPRAGHTECPESAFAGVANEEAVRGAWQACYSLGLHSAPWSGHCGRRGRRGFQAQDPLLSPQVCAGAGASSTQE